MALVRSEFMFKIYPAKVVCKQKAKLRPNEHHYEKEGEDGIRTLYKVYLPDM